MYPYWALTGIALYAVARELRAPPQAAVIGACVALAIPAIAVPALIAGLVDALALFGLVSGILFLLRFRRTRAGRELAFAGLALGVAFGTKWYAVWAVAIVVCTWAVAEGLDRRSARRLLSPGAALVGLIALAGGIWLLRNLVESGNPVFPVQVSVLGATLFGSARRPGSRCSATSANRACGANGSGRSFAGRSPGPGSRSGWASRRRARC
jgi:hypothetical protein